MIITAICAIENYAIWHMHVQICVLQIDSFVLHVSQLRYFHLQISLIIKLYVRNCLWRAQFQTRCTYFDVFHV